MNSISSSSRPINAALLGALVISLLIPVMGHAEEPTAPAASSTDHSAHVAPAADTEQQAPQPGADPHAKALHDKIESLGPQATPEQVSAAQQEYLQQNGITGEEANRVLNDADSFGEPAPQAIPEEAPVVHDLSPWGMYQNADVVVKSVMIGLIIASIITWTIWIAKSFELVAARRRLRRELADLKGVRTLNQAAEQARVKNSFSTLLIEDAREEIKLSAAVIREKDSIKERVSFRLERLVAACGRDMSKGTGVLATIGSTAPFVGLFGTVWGIMNSFIGIAKTQTTNLAVVAPGIAEALLATALGLVAAIPAVIIYNVFARSIAAYKAQVADASAQVLLLVSRDLDHQSNGERSSSHMAKAV
ncbi:tonB-system energizer ExbB [Pseudomonas sp. LRF_L74]|uniref:tonB-system energizer ExbB n=1 Tax=Pseudomonas sp. LRF_L74 TaxID=3369422 RepID=UPI003F5E1CB7